ncbi:MAG: helix-turn-helix domain-containing protein [Rickettsiales bacterium]
MHESIRILVCLADTAVAATVVEYLRLRGYTPSVIQRLTADELWMEGNLLLADEASVKTYDNSAPLPSLFILLGKTIPEAILPAISHHEIVSLPLRLSDLGKAIARIVTRASISPEHIELQPGISFYPKERLLRSVSKTPVELTEKEASLLAALLQERHQAVSRESLLKDVWRYQAGVDTHTLETHIYRLRQKISEAGGDEKMIVTTPEGYRFQALQDAVL